MNITSQSMEAMILRNINDPDADPHLKKLFAELQALKKGLNGPRVGMEPKDSKPTGQKATNTNRVVKPKRRRTEGDPTVTFKSYLYAERRSSDRLSGKIPRYKLMDDIDELENNTLFSNGVQKTSNNGIKPNNYFSRQYFHVTQRVILMPEQITDNMLNNICYKLTDKIYDPANGSSCHQCRQKTIDTKTICRNLECFGVRGQFCGPCAQNRYGVDVATALLDPYWSCFVCQGICNCSFCRSRKGQRPTGILAPIAKREGHECVKDFLDELKSKLFEEDDLKDRLTDPDSVLGFADDSVVLVGGNKMNFGRQSTIETLLMKEMLLDFGETFCGFPPNCA